MMADPYARLDAVYLLGALDADERARRHSGPRHVLRTSVEPGALDSSEVVSSYKALAQVERACCSSPVLAVSWWRGGPAGPTHWRGRQCSASPGHRGARHGTHGPKSGVSPA